MSAPTPDVDELPRRRRWPLLVGAAVVLLGAAAVWLTRPHPPPETPAHALFRTLLPGWVVAKSNGDPSAEAALASCVTAAKPWPEVARALEALPAAWPSRDTLRAATKELNRALHAASLDFWVDPQFPGRSPILTTYEVLGRATWSSGAATTEVLHVRRLDTLNLEMGVLGHAGADQPAVLRDRVEVAVVDKLRSLDANGEAPNAVDELGARLWREQLGRLSEPGALAEAERRLNQREKLVREMEHRLRDGRAHVTRPERLVFGPAYFAALEPYTSTRLRGGPVILASDLRSLQRADEALDDSAGLQALVRAIDVEAETVEAHEANHALDRRELKTPELLQKLVGEEDERFGHLAERELRAYLGQLHDSGPPACLTVVLLAALARGRNSESTPHFFAAHALLSTLGDVDGESGVTEAQAAEVMKAMCALPDAELRRKVEAAAETLYGTALQPARRTSFTPAGR